MLAVAKKGLRVVAVPQVVPVVAFHVHRWPAEITTLHLRSQTSGYVTELVVVTGNDRESLALCQAQKGLRFARVEGERLLDVDVAAELQTALRNGKMTVRRRGHRRSCRNQRWQS